MEPIQYARQTTAMDLGALLDAHEDAVVILVAGDTRLAVHRAVLEARSPVFAAMFGNDMLEASSGQVTIPDVEGPVLRQLLAYLYTLQAPQLPGMAAQLLAAADKYGVSSLKAECERQLAKQLSVETAASIAVLAVRHSCTSLKDDAINFMKTHTQVMATKGWADAMRMQTEDAIEVSRLFGDPPAENSQTLASTALVAGNSRHTPPPDDATVSALRHLSAEEKNKRLIAAAKQGAVGELGALLAAGADVAARDGGEMTALHWAAAEGREEAARRLLAAGAAVDARDRWQETPLHWAAGGGHAAVVRLLLAANADHGARTGYGSTPLHLAADNGHAEAAAALLQGGADRAARDNEGRTPLDRARIWNRQQVVELLLQGGSG